MGKSDPGDPNAVPAFREGIEALYAAAYTLKFMIKKGNPSADYVVAPLEGLGWMDDMTKPFPARKGDRNRTLLIMQPVGLA